MGRLRSVAAFVLLAAFAVGGFGAPVLHEIAHAGEAAEALAHRADADHHHHTALDDHGAEALPPCAEALDADLTCVLCAAAGAAVALAEVPLVRHDDPARLGTEAEGVAAHDRTSPDARGPPALV